MIYYQGYAISFQEVPDETSLVLLIADCPHRCPGCHSPELQRPEGKNLLADLPGLIDQYADAITCVCFMGDGQDVAALTDCFHLVKTYGLKACLYTGGDAAPDLPWDYVKVGQYVEALGGLDSPTTNQRMYRFQWVKAKLAVVDDITQRFQVRKE